ncbi:nuclear transport factor 2 family protein [Pyxidicoccus sp. 3LFB2]
MSNITRPRSALELLDAHLTLIASDIPRWLTLFADDAIVEFPYAAGTGLPSRLVGKEAIRNYFSGTPGVFKNLTFRDIRKHGTQDPDVAIGEAHGSATIATTSRPYEQDYVFVLQCREGRILRYREYWNPNAATESFGSLENVVSAMEAR